MNWRKNNGQAISGNHLSTRQWETDSHKFAGANKKCIDLMMGHKSKDVGERVYTHKTIDELRDAIL